MICIATVGLRPGTRVRTHNQSHIVAPVYQGRRGTPVLFGRPLFADLGAVQGDKGGRDLIARHTDRLATVEVDDPKVFQDIDLLEDYKRLR